MSQIQDFDRLEQQVRNVQVANKSKQKLRKLFQNIDQTKTGLLPEIAFFDILQLNNIMLSESDKRKIILKNQGPSNTNVQFIKYRDSLTMIHIDSEAQEIDPTNIKWVYRQNESKDTVSYFGGGTFDGRNNHQLLTGANVNSGQAPLSPEDRYSEPLKWQQSEGNIKKLTKTNVKVLDKEQKTEGRNQEDTQFNKTMVTKQFTTLNTSASQPLSLVTNFNLNQQKLFSPQKQFNDQQTKAKLMNHHQDQMSVMSKAIDDMRSQAATGALQFSPKKTVRFSKQRGSPFNTKKEVTLKGHRSLEQLFDSKANTETDIFEKMQQQALNTNEGKKFFKAVNVTNPANLMHLSDNPTFAQSTAQQDFYDKSGIVYVPPPVTKKIKLKTSFVHNQVANKAKTNDEHMNRIKDVKVYNPKKHQILKELHQHGIEFRTMTALKNALYDSDLLQNQNMLPLDEYEQIRKYNTLNLIDPVNHLILEEIQTCQNGEQVVDLWKFTDLLDLYTLLPMKKVTNANASTDIYKILSSNMLQGATITNTDEGGQLQKMLDLLWIKLEERFKTIGDAYRYFDKNYNNRVSFGEFQKALDHLRIKYQVDIIAEIFQKLDRGTKGYISYNDFCELSEEKRRNLDAFDLEIKKIDKQKSVSNSQKKVKNDKLTDKQQRELLIDEYLNGTSAADLEILGKWRTPKYKSKNTSATNALHPAEVQIPSWIQKNDNHRYGIASKVEGSNIKASYAVSNLIQNEYNRKFLNDKITKQADNLIQKKFESERKKNWSNKVHQLRSQTIQKNIQDREQNDLEEYIKVSSQRQGSSITSSKFSVTSSKFKQSRHSVISPTRLPLLNTLPGIGRKNSSVAHQIIDEEEENEPLNNTMVDNFNEPSFQLDLQNNMGQSPKMSYRPNFKTDKLGLSSRTVVKMHKTPRIGKQGQLLDSLHQMRVKIFDDRKKSGYDLKVKPFVPFLSADEREKIQERYRQTKTNIAPGDPISFMPITNDVK